MAKERGKRWKMILYTSAISPNLQETGTRKDNGKFDLNVASNARIKGRVSRLYYVSLQKRNV